MMASLQPTLQATLQAIPQAIPQTITQTTSSTASLPNHLHSKLASTINASPINVNIRFFSSRRPLNPPQPSVLGDPDAKTAEMDNHTSGWQKVHRKRKHSRNLQRHVQTSRIGTRVSPSASKQSLQCWKCNKFGHLKRHCKLPHQIINVPKTLQKHSDVPKPASTFHSPPPTIPSVSKAPKPSFLQALLSPPPPMDNIHDFFDERPHMPHVFLPPTIPLTPHTDYLNRLALIHFIQGAPNHAVMIRIRNYLAHISGWPAGEYEIRRATIAPVVIICPGQANRDGLSRQRPYRLQMAPNHSIEFTVTAWNPHFGMAFDPMPFEAHILLRAPPLQVWSPHHLPSLISSFGYVVNAQPYGMPDGLFLEIPLHIHCIHPGSIPRHIMFHQGHRAVPFDVILLRWRPLQHGPPPPWNDGQQNRQLSLNHQQVHSSGSSARTPSAQCSSQPPLSDAPPSSGSVHQRQSPVWVQKNLLHHVTKHHLVKSAPSSKVFWLQKSVTSSNSPPCKPHSQIHPTATANPATLPETATLSNPYLPSGLPKPSFLFSPPAFFSQTLYRSSLLLRTPTCFPTIFISLTATLVYSRPLLEKSSRLDLQSDLSHSEWRIQLPQDFDYSPTPDSRLTSSVPPSYISPICHTQPAPHHLFREFESPKLHSGPQLNQIPFLLEPNMTLPPKATFPQATNPLSKTQAPIHNEIAHCIGPHCPTTTHRQTSSSVSTCTPGQSSDTDGPQAPSSQQPRRSPRLAGKKVLTREHSRRKRTSVKAPAPPFFMPLTSVHLEETQALHLLQASDLQITDEIRSMVTEAILADLHAQPPQTPEHSSVPPLQGPDGSYL